jgi:hypothetical protein
LRLGQGKIAPGLCIGISSNTCERCGDLRIPVKLNAGSGSSRTAIPTEGEHGFLRSRTGV